VPHSTAVRYRRPLVIAHRGASGFLPEHTLEAKALAHGLGADYLEQDLVLTKDDVPIVLHDLYLDTVTDVATRFPGRHRNDGRYYAIDFLLEEIRQLTVSERFSHETGRAVFPNRFPAHTGRFRIPTFVEELQFIQGLNHSTGRIAGIYPEIKQPEFHERSDKDIAGVVVDVLSQSGYETADAPCYLQCFHPGTLQRLRHKEGCQLTMIQLLEARDCPPSEASSADLQEFFEEIATYAQGIGPDLKRMLRNSVVVPSATLPQEESLLDSRFVETAHAAGLLIHPWTLRRDALPSGIDSFETLHQLLAESRIDGVFSDFPGDSRNLFERFE